MFVAVWPDGTTRERLASLDLPVHPDVRVVRPDEWHVTLRFLGEVDGGLVPPLVGALEEAARAVVAPVRCVLGPAAAWFPRGRVLQLPAGGLDEVAAAVRSATLPLVPAGRSGEAPFRGHLTLARAGPAATDRPVQQDMAAVGFTGWFAVDALELVGSRRTADGPRYTTLGGARLAGGP